MRLDKPSTVCRCPLMGGVWDDDASSAHVWCTTTSGLAAQLFVHPPPALASHLSPLHPPLIACRAWTPPPARTCGAW